MAYGASLRRLVYTKEGRFMPPVHKALHMLDDEAAVRILMLLLEVRLGPGASSSIPMPFLKAQCLPAMLHAKPRLLWGGLRRLVHPGLSVSSAQPEGVGVVLQNGALVDNKALELASELESSERVLELLRLCRDAAFDN